MSRGLRQSTFERFAQATVLRKSDGTLLAGFSHYPYGSVVVCLAHGRPWQQWCEQDLDLEPEAVTPDRVGDPFERMLEAAGQGCVGFLLFEEKVERFLLFMGRFDELSNPLPSILCTVPTEPEEVHEYLASYGPAQLLHDEILHWQRFDILDPVNAQLGATQPFANWEPGQQFYELLSDRGELVVLLESDIFGPWHPVEGAVPIYSHPDCAKMIVESPRPPQIGLVGLPGPEQGLTRVADLGRFTLFRIDRLEARLEFLQQAFPLGAAVFNPHSHRNSTAYTRFFQLGAAHKTVAGWTLKSTSGVWALRPGHQLERQKDRQHWNREDADTYSWSGGPSYRLADLPCEARSFPAAKLGHNRPFSSDSEREEFLTNWLGGGELDLIYEEASQLRGAPNRFLIQAWDSVSGEKHPGLWFPTALHAIRFLSHFERADRSIRINGAQGCGPANFVKASSNPETEQLKGYQFQKSLHRVAARILIHGYRPKDADDLTYLCNHLLGTLIINLAGYATDIVKRNLEQEKTLHRTMGINPRLAAKCLLRLDRLEENPGTRIARTQIGPYIWAKLTNQSQIFLATALDTRRCFKDAPCYDFSGVVVQICKSVEIELGRALKHLLTPLNKENPEPEQFERDDGPFVDFVWKDKKTLTLGQFCHILKEANQQKSKLWSSAYTAILQADGSALLAKPFYNKALNKLLHSFRNPAAHDKVFNLAQFDECVQLVLGSDQQTGLLRTIFSQPLEQPVC